MNNFLQDIWHDLREKKLWPVAALLTLALLAVPVVLKRDSEGAADSTPVAAVPATPESKGPVIETADDGVFRSSDLKAFDAKDPFKPQVKKLKQDSQLSLGIDPTAGGGAAGAPGAGGGGGSTGGGSTLPPPTGGGGAPTIQYTYVADVAFGRPGRLRRIKGLRRLEMLPNSDSPLLVFLGATSSGDDAVFLVDSTLEQAGEGSCADKACSLLSIGPGSEHRFLDDNNREYVLRIDEIRRVRVSEASRSRARAKTAAVSNASERTDSAARSARSLVSALLVDVETLASTDAGASSARRDRR